MWTILIILLKMLAMEFQKLKPASLQDAWSEIHVFCTKDE